MGDSLYVNMRDKERHTIDLRATYSIKGQDKEQQDCKITNLSSSGATVHFPRTESLSSGSFVAMDITIPNTILRIAAEAEVMWTRERFNELLSGIKFTGMLSDSMIRQLVKKAP